MGMEKLKEMGLWGMSETFRFQMSFLNKAKCSLYIYIYNYNNVLLLFLIY